MIGWDCCTKEHRRDYLSLAGYTSGRIDRAQTILAHAGQVGEGLRDLFAKAKLAKPTGMLVIDQVKESVQVIANSSQDFSLERRPQPRRRQQRRMVADHRCRAAPGLEPADHRHPGLCGQI